MVLRAKFLLRRCLDPEGIYPFKVVQVVDFLWVTKSNPSFCSDPDHLSGSLRPSKEDYYLMVKSPFQKNLRHLGFTSFPKEV